MDCIVLYCICCVCCIDGLRCIVLYCIVLYVLHCCISIEGWSRIWPSNEFIPHHTSAPPDHRPRVYKTKMQSITMLEGWTDHIHSAVRIVQYRKCLSFLFIVVSLQRENGPSPCPSHHNKAKLKVLKKVAFRNHGGDIMICWYKSFCPLPRYCIMFFWNKSLLSNLI